MSWLFSRIEGSTDSDSEDRVLLESLKNAFVSSIKACDYDSADAKSVLHSYERVVQSFGGTREVVNTQGRSMADIINLFTTNYDLFNERALEASRFCYTDGFTNGLNNIFSVTEFHHRPIDLDDRFRDHLQPIKPFFRLYKLHGSINWKKVDSSNLVERVSGVDLGSDDVMISPMTSKFALTQNAPYSDLFREFVNILAQPNTALFVTGFSFGDEHIASLIKEALSRPDFTLIAFISNPNLKDKEDSLRRFCESVQSPNAYFIFPENKTPFFYSSFADMISQDIDKSFAGNDETDLLDGPR